ncbi:MAG TPA: MerR family transcriptional regulator [Dongiaceae bacterium]|nr:MerR family transcriptional regulator [Dongiaceae bacterium]
MSIFDDVSHHSIKVVAQRTGLSSHVIRAWEKRYATVKPERTGTNRRLYSDEDIERLNLLRHATQAGHSISNISNLSIAELKDLVAQAGKEAPLALTTAKTESPFVAECLAAVRALDTAALHEILGRATVVLGSHGLLETVVAPLTEQVGNCWRDGVITAAHEHFASNVLRTFLGEAARPFAPNGQAPGLVVCTPVAQLHELGAVMVAAAANDLGWRVTYLGCSLPAAEIAGAAIQNRARAVALSIVYPEDDPALPGELEKLRQYLPATIAIIAGGRAAAAYRIALAKIGARQTTDLPDFYGILAELRHPVGK